MRKRWVIGLLFLALAAGACSGDDDSDVDANSDADTEETEAPDEEATTTTAAPEVAYEGYTSDVYADPASWLCRGDVADDPCDVDMDASIVEADGGITVEPFESVEDAPVDCFYVYPTISTDATPNSDMTPGDDQEIFVVRQQAARLGSVCRVFAPVYRQVTLTSLAAGIAGTATEADREMTYGDVVDAWKHYMANDNGGRGVVLIGHSQGSGLLTQLITDEIDAYADLRDRLVGAYLLGSVVAVPEGESVGGAFQNVPLCGAAGEVGCVVTYASFRSDAPPPESSFFGRVRSGEGEAACVNPASLGGGAGPLVSYFAADGRAILSGQAPSSSDWSSLGEVTTPFVALPDLVSAECINEGGFSYLALTVNGDPSDPRIDNIPGDLTPEWGMHLVDVNVAMGTIVDLVEQQIEAYTAT